jgi:hypothetical protein
LLWGNPQVVCAFADLRSGAFQSSTELDGLCTLGKSKDTMTVLLFFLRFDLPPPDFEIIKISGEKN